MSEKILAQKRDIRGIISSSKNCPPCNLTQGVCLKGANSFANFAMYGGDFNNTIVFYIKKISGNGIFYTNIDNFLQKRVANNNFMLEVPYSKQITLSRQSDAIGDISIYKISIMGNKKQEILPPKPSEDNLPPPAPLVFINSVNLQSNPSALFLAQKNAMNQINKPARSTIRDGRAVNRKLYTNDKDYKFNVLKILSKPFNIETADNSRFVLFLGKSVWDTPSYTAFFNMLDTYDLTAFSFNILEEIPIELDSFNFLLEKSINIISDFHSTRSLRQYIYSDNLPDFIDKKNLVDKIIRDDVGYKQALDCVLLNSVKPVVENNNSFLSFQNKIAEYKIKQMEEALEKEGEKMADDDMDNQIKKEMPAPVVEAIVEVPQIDVKQIVLSKRPKDAVRFKVIIPSYNSVKWIKKTLNSVSDQDYKYYDVCIVDDNSTDPKQREIIKEHCEKFNNKNNTWKYIFNKTRQGALYNIELAINNSGCEDGDVCATLDGDDFFFNSKVLSLVNSVYQSGDVMLTYGQYVSYPTMTCGHCKEYHPRIIQERAYRKADWLMSHLRTFKYKLWKNIKHEDLLDPRTGKHWKMSWDLAIMYPMGEMCGDRLRFIPQYTYTYNRENPLNDDKVNLNLQVSSNMLIRKKPKYPYLK